MTPHPPPHPPHSGRKHLHLHTATSSSLPKSKMGGAATISEVAVWREFFDILAYWFKFGITPLSHLLRFFLTPSPARPLGGAAVGDCFGRSTQPDATSLSEKRCGCHPHLIGQGYGCGGVSKLHLIDRYRERESTFCMRISC